MRDIPAVIALITKNAQKVRANPYLTTHFVRDIPAVIAYILQRSELREVEHGVQKIH